MCGFSGLGNAQQILKVMLVLEAARISVVGRGKGFYLGVIDIDLRLEFSEAVSRVEKDL